MENVSYTVGWCLFVALLNPLVDSTVMAISRCATASTGFSILLLRDRASEGLASRNEQCLAMYREGYDGYNAICLTICARTIIGSERPLDEQSNHVIPSTYPFTCREIAA